MANRRHTLIAREGWLYIAAALLAGGLLWLLAGPLAATPAAAVALMYLYLYRDPYRRVPARPLGVISPIDGTVIAVEKQRDPYLDREAWVLVLRMSPSGVFSMRAPIEGKVQRNWSEPGFAHWVQTDEQDDIVWEVREAGRVRPRCYVQPGERVGQGQRCGFVFRGREMALYLPVNARVEIEPGQRIVAGETITATLVHQRAVGYNDIHTGLVTGH